MKLQAGTLMLSINELAIYPYGVCIYGLFTEQ